MGEEILTKPQKVVIAAVAETPELQGAYLSGGTALSAYYFQHRQSDDLDFFSGEDFDDLFLKTFSEKLAAAIGASGVRYQRLYERRQFFFSLNRSELKIEFTKYPYTPLESFREQDGIHVDSLRDIAANKLMAMLDRFEPKDFADLYFLLQDRSLSDVTRDVETKFKMRIEPLFLGSELAKVKRIEALPRMIKPLTIPVLREFFSHLAEGLSTDVIEG